MNRQAIERTVVGVLVAGFVIGAITHTLHLVNVGWVVFDAAPTWMNVYWTALKLRHYSDREFARRFDSA